MRWIVVKDLANRPIIVNMDNVQYIGPDISDDHIVMVFSRNVTLSIQEVPPEIATYLALPDR